MKNEIILYQPDENLCLNVMLEDNTVWLTQQQLAILFGKDQSVIARHIQNIFNEGELDEKSNMQILHNTLSKYKPTKIYSLDVIISVGYRVKTSFSTVKCLMHILLVVEKHNSQYPPIEIKVYSQSHDRFLIIDDDTYHIGASIKDLGKKWFAFSLLHFDKKELMAHIML